jgi:putative DNA-invertase from lambdoid prophage Rac
MPPLSRAALYHRVSTTDQDPTAAREDLRQAAQARGLSVVLDIEETGSGKRNDRPGLLRILEAARRGRVDIVIVWKLDRFGRSALDVLSNIQHLVDAGVRFVCITQGIDIKPGGDAVSRLMLTVLAAVAEFERELIVERTRLGLEAARRNGKRLGRPPGSKADPGRVAQLRAAGMSWAQVASALGVSRSTARRASAG